MAIVVVKIYTRDVIMPRGTFWFGLVVNRRVRWINTALTPVVNWHPMGSLLEDEIWPSEQT